MMAKNENSEEQVDVVVECVLVYSPGDPESRERVVHAILAWAEEHPDEWDAFQARCQQRHEAPA